MKVKFFLKLSLLDYQIVVVMFSEVRTYIGEIEAHRVAINSHFWRGYLLSYTCMFPDEEVENILQGRN